MIYAQLFYEFFKIGLFAVGGGLATVPFLQRLGESSGWYDQQLIVDMIAISESTPGAMGINMATYVGYHVGGFLGGMVATFGEILPSIIIVVFFSKSLEKITNNPRVKDGFYGMRAAVTGLIGAVAYQMVISTIFTLDLWKEGGAILSLPKGMFFVVIYLAIVKWKLHPICYIALSALFGILIPL
ncbi:MAG: chromate transporter [Eubacteriales bacterium]